MVKNINIWQQGGFGCGIFGDKITPYYFIYSFNTSPVTLEARLTSAGDCSISLNNQSRDYSYRPIVTLNSNVSIDTSNTSKDGSDLDNAWEIK